MKPFLPACATWGPQLRCWSNTIPRYFALAMGSIVISCSVSEGRAFLTPWCEKLISASLLYSIEELQDLDQSIIPVKAPPMVGPTWTRVRLTLGSDCSPLLFQGTALLLPSTLCLIHCSLMHVRCQMIQGCTSMSPPLFPYCVYAPEGYAS